MYINNIIKKSQLMFWQDGHVSYYEKIEFIICNVQNYIYTD